MLKKLKKLQVPLKTERGRKWIVRDGSKPEEFVTMDVIGYDEYYEEYLVKIPDDVAGYTISYFHLMHFSVPENMLWKRFNSFNPSS